MLRLLQKILCAAVVVALLAACPALASSTTAKVNSSSARVYKTASTSSASVKMKKGTKLTVKSVSGSWAKVTLGGKTGYMPVKYLKKTSRKKVYISRDTYVYKSASSSSGKTSVSRNTAVYVVGKSGSYYRVQNASGSRSGYVKASCISSSKSSGGKSSGKKTSMKSKVVKMQWFNGGSKVLKKGGYGYIYDIKTGIKVKIKRMGGHNHADVEPATAADTRKLLRVSGGKWSWDSRSEILIAGGKYVACAINTMPHGDQTIHDNNYEGQFCLHMSGSKTHCSDKENSNHQAAINAAYNWAH